MSPKRGFSLIEMALVLMVVSAVIGGIVATRSLIRSSQMKAVMSEYEMYATAIRNFKTKYHALPGDFSEATAVWGEISANCKVGAATGTKTCDGDGDSRIEFDSTPSYEHIAAWRHLALSGFVNQNFTGNTVAGGVCNIDIRGGSNVPASRLKGASWNLGVNYSGTIYTGGVAGDQYFPIHTCTADRSLHALWLGGSLQDDNAQASSCAHSQIPIFTGYEAYELDTKFDDKRAVTGKIRDQYNNTGTYQSCEDSGSTSGKYRVNATGVNCALVFLLDI